MTIKLPEPDDYLYPDCVPKTPVWFPESMRDFYRVAYRAGQEAMRERAAKFLDSKFLRDADDLEVDLASQIRALPID